jgi:hypothetical protein
MNMSTNDNETLETGMIEDFLAVVTERKLHTGIAGYRKPSEGGRVYMINTREGDIPLVVTQIADRDFAFPISKAEYNSGRYSLFISKPSAETPWAVDLNRRDTSILRRIQAMLREHEAKSDPIDAWLLVFSTSGYPEIECCVRGNSRDSDAVSMARDYLSKQDRIPFDQIWFSNRLTLPVRIWPYGPGPIY